jgi:hypothetical protein
VLDNWKLSLLAFVERGKPFTVRTPRMLTTFLNTPRFGVPVNNLSSPAFGQIQMQETNSRTLRLGVRLSL